MHTIWHHASLGKFVTDRALMLSCRVHGRTDCPNSARTRELSQTADGPSTSIPY